MRELTLKSRRFREEREQDWLALEALLARMEGGRSEEHTSELQSH